MWSTTPLLLLLSVGVSIILTAGPETNAEAQKFIDRVTRSIASRDVDIISGLFQPSFSFRGCSRRRYNKKKVVKMLSELPAETQISSKLKYSEGKRNGEIRYGVEITGFGKPFLAHFLLSRFDQQLISGEAVNCYKDVVRKRESIYSDHVAEPFLKNLLEVIGLKDAAKIANFFRPDFVFKGCKGEYNKKKIVELLQKGGKNISIRFVVSEHVRCRQIKMECYVTGIGEDFRADLFFHIDDKQLVDGNNAECNKERDARSEVPLERAQLEHGLDIARDKMCYNDTSGLELLFDDKFTLEGCQETINKTMALKYIWEMIDPKDPFEYHVSMARFEVSTIESIVTIKGIQGKEFVIELHYDPNSQILHRAKSLSCGGPGK